MGQDPALKRRSLLQGAAALALAGCARDEPRPLQGGWVGAAHERGHRLRSAAPAATGPLRRAAVLIVGAGVAGLAAARAFDRQGVDDVHLLELEDAPGGNSRGHVLGGIACPLGAHYLPLPGEPAREVAQWLHELGLLRSENGRTVADERHLCHSPQERLFFDGAWHEGLLPPAEPGSDTHSQYRGFAAAIDKAPRFSIPSHRAPWNAELASLDGQTFAVWLAAQRLDDPRLRWYLDYCCRDDFGAGLATVSAWAGLHYFASRHGFHAPGDADGEREPVFTWPEGNAWLVNRLAAPLQARIHGGRVVHRVSESRHGVEVLASSGGEVERWFAGTVVLAVPLMVASRLLESPPAALQHLARTLVYAPWLVANLLLDKPPVDRPGMPPAWDNVGYGTHGLGYVDATHQNLSPSTGATVLTAYANVAPAQRQRLLDEPWQAWARRVIGDFGSVHPDLPLRLQRIELMRYGHAMVVPLPGVQSDPARSALRGGGGRVRFAHSDLAGYSIFEEAFTAGHDAAREPCRCA